MTSRQRLLNCLKRQPIDRVPISSYELCGFDFDAWYNNEPSYKKLMDEIREKCDCILMYNPEYIYTATVIENNYKRQGDAVTNDAVWKTNAGDFYMKTKEADDVKTLWRIEHYLKDVDDIERFLKVELEVPQVSMDKFYEQQTQLGENGIMMLDFGDPLCDAADLLGMDNLLIFLYTDYDIMIQLLDKLFENKMEIVRQVAKNDIKDVMVRIYGPEYCTPPYLPPAMFPDICTKYLTPMIEVLNAAGAITRIHSHGNIKDNLDEFVKTGAVCIDPVEPIPDGNISLSDVKKQYGDKLILMGNIELKDLENSSKDTIKNLVKQAMDEAKDGGGFILLPSATPINIPLYGNTLENFITMFDTALEYGKY